MGAGEEVARTVIQVTSKASIMTLQTILKTIATAKGRGEQSLQSLSSKNVPLDKIPVSNVDIKQMKEILKQYGIDFAVVKNKGTQDFTLYFKGTDTVAITSALEQVVSSMDVENRKGTPDLSVRVKDGVERAEQHNKNLVTEKKAERTADHSLDIPKTQGREPSI